MWPFQPDGNKTTPHGAPLTGNDGSVWHDYQSGIPEMARKHGFRVSDPTGSDDGYVLARDAWGKGFATEALTAIIDVASRIGVSRLFAPCHIENRPSQRVLEKCAFVRDDVLKPMMEFPNLSPGVRREALYYALVLSPRTNPAS